MKHWSRYVELQGELAHEALAEAPPYPGPGPGAGTLFIGPGGPEELHGAWSILPQPFTVLTAYAAEAARIRAAWPEMHVVVGDLHDMPFPFEAFAAIYCHQVLEHALAPYVALLECRRVLRTGGRAFFTMPSFEGIEGGRGPFHLHCLDARVWIELLRKTGFIVATEHEPGGVDPSGFYTHYRCEATAPPRPHDLMLRRIIAAKELT